jgi:hypothetical protein
LIPDVFTFAPRQAQGTLLILNVMYAPNPSSINSAAAYSVQSGKITNKVVYAHFEPGRNGDPGRVDLQLEHTPRNGGSLKVSFNPPSGPKVDAGLLAGTTVPKGTSTDPSGGADIYVAVNFTRNAQANATTPANVYGVNTTLQHRFWLAALGDSNFLFLNPAFSGKLYSKGQDNENTMTFSAPLGIQSITRWLNPVIEQTIVTASPTFEIDELAHNKNLVADLQFAPLFVDQPFLNRKLGRFRFAPFVGGEIGHTYHSDLQQLNGASVERFKTGATAEWKFTVNAAYLNAVTLRASYTYRNLFDREIFMTTKNVKLPAGTLTTASGQSVTVPGGTLSEQIFPIINASPRRYLDTSILFGLTANFSAQLEYSRGELPPAFQRVDKLQAGLAFLFNFRNK